MVSERIRKHVAGQWSGLIALFLVITGGTAYALDGSNTVYTDDIVNGQVRSADVVNDSSTAALTGIDIGNGSLTAADIADGSLTGADVDESTLATVPSARQGGLGRYGYDGACEPSGTTYLQCSTTSIDLARPGRVLILGQVTASSDEYLHWGGMSCLLTADGNPIVNSRTDVVFDSAYGGQESATLIAISHVLPSGTHGIGVSCNDAFREGEPAEAVTYPHARVVGVALSGE